MFDEETPQNDESVEQVEQEETLPEDTPNPELEAYKELISKQAEQMEEMNKHINSLTGQIANLIKSGAQVTTSSNSINPFIEQKTPERFANVKPLDELDFNFK